MNTTTDPDLVINKGPTPKSGGIKATWHLKIVTGKEAQALLEMQNQAIISLLTWAADHEKTESHNVDGRTEMASNDSRETFGLAAWGK